MIFRCNKEKTCSTGSTGNEKSAGIVLKEGGKIHIKFSVV